MAKVLILTEKPSVARDIAQVVKAWRKMNGYFEGDEYQVSWALGHLVTLPEPSEINPLWEKWRTDTLPMIPTRWPLKVIEKTQAQFEVVQSLFRSCDKIVCATDAGREGELIFRYIYEKIGVEKPVQRMWISSLTPAAIQLGLQNLRPIQDFDSLSNAARARSCADWLVGMNLSRAYALSHREKYFVGRVQTPTLALIVARDEEIAHFAPEDYFEISAVFRTEGQMGSSFEGSYLGPVETVDLNRLPILRLKPPGEEIQKKVNRIKGGQAEVKSLDSKNFEQPPPLFYDLTELQRQSNRLFEFSAQKTLEVAQALYEKHKLISYPRTDSRYLTQAVEPTLQEIVKVIRVSYENLIQHDTGERPLGSRYVNDREVSDHHAIIPTGISKKNCSLTQNEGQLFDLICRRFLCAWQPDRITSTTTLLVKVKTRSDTSSQVDELFKTQGTLLIQAGWKLLESWGPDFQDELLLPPLKEKAPLQVSSARMHSKKTKAPPYLNDATLLTHMENAGKTLTDRELAKSIRDSGLGTPATRAATIESLLSRGYAERKGKNLVSTELGARLIQTVHPKIKSPELTAKWERDLAKIQNQQKEGRKFLEELGLEIREQLQEIFKAPPKARTQYSLIKVESALIEKVAQPIRSYLEEHGTRAVGKLFEYVVKKAATQDRRVFESVLETMRQRGEIRIQEETFLKAGETIRYRRVLLSEKASLS